MIIQILICTRNRATLLERALDDIDLTSCPAGTEMQVLMAAIACRDGARELLRIRADARAKRCFRVGFIEEPTPGKSNALATAMPQLQGGVVAMVDGDHRVDTGHFDAIAEAVTRFPEATNHCGKILSDCTGFELAWVHDRCDYAIYPLPTPHYDQGEGGERNLVIQLRKPGLDRNTIVVNYSDHGMECFENTAWGQGNGRHGNAGNRIPLLIVDPREQQPSYPANLARAFDITATLLDKLCIAAPDGIDSVLLRPMIDDQPMPEFPGFFESGLWLANPPGQHPQHIRYPELPGALDVPCNRSGTLAIEDEYKGVVNVGVWHLNRIALSDVPAHERCYLRSDPDCTANRTEEMSRVVTSVAAMMRTYMQSPPETTATTRI